MTDAATTSVETDIIVNTDTTNEVDNKDSVLTGTTTEDKGDDNNSNVDGNTPTDDNTDDNTDVNQNDTGTEDDDVSPETYADFSLPEGVELDETALAEANPLFKEIGLNQEQAQKVIDLYAKQIQASSVKQVDSFNQLMKDWRDKSSNDKEFGGDKFEENVKIAQSAIAKLGTPELKQLLEEHGVGNHPEVIRFMVRVGQTLKEDVPGSSGSTPNQVVDRVELMYPKDT